ncbi:ankyrin repeat-containing domain protein [Diaporthe sp. PMI_573]|nr:ankyrin repeat-containing domain protein [Diaporthaceae sp. PMI_573]
MDKGADLEMFGPNQSTALMCAAGGGELGVVAMLLGAGAEVDALGRAGASALHYAASCGFQQVTRLLLDSGASATLLNKSGETPLSLIVKYGYGKCWSREKRLDGAEKVLRMLLKAGADVNRASRRRGETALLFLSDHQAKPLRDTVSTASDHSDQAGYDSLIDIPEIDPRSSDLQAMDILLQAGADPNQVDKAGNTALMRSSRSCELDKIQLLLANGANKDMVNNCGESALLIALKERRGLEVVKELLVAGADPSQELGGGNSVLSELISRNGIPHSDSELDEVLETIIAAGADLKTSHENGDTLLLQAARSGSLAIKALLAAGADLQASDNHGRNAIMLASMLDFDQGAEAVHLLLDAGVDPHRRDCNGDTALMLAAKSHYSPITLRNLLGSGLDADERDINGSTALMSVAYRSGDRESEARICALIEAGVSLDAADKEGNTALIIAAEHGYSIRALVDAGADPNAANKYGETALMKCFSHPWRVFEKVQTLLDAGAHVNVLDCHRRDALMWAALRQELSEDVDAVKLLLSSGISLEHEDENGDTALACAERTSNTQTANWIRKEIRKRAKGGVVKQDKETVQGSQNTEGVTEKSPADSVAHMVAD